MTSCPPGRVLDLSKNTLSSTSIPPLDLSITETTGCHSLPKHLSRQTLPTNGASFPDGKSTKGRNISIKDNNLKYQRDLNDFEANQARYEPPSPVGPPSQNLNQLIAGYLDLSPTLGRIPSPRPPPAHIGSSHLAQSPLPVIGLSSGQTCVNLAQISQGNFPAGVSHQILGGSLVVQPSSLLCFQHPTASPAPLSLSPVTTKEVYLMLPAIKLEATAATCPPPSPPCPAPVCGLPPPWVPDHRARIISPVPPRAHTHVAPTAHDHHPSSWLDALPGGLDCSTTPTFFDLDQRMKEEDSNDFCVDEMKEDTKDDDEEDLAVDFPKGDEEEIESDAFEMVPAENNATSDCTGSHLRCSVCMLVCDSQAAIESHMDCHFCCSFEGCGEHFLMNKDLIVHEFHVHNKKKVQRKPFRCNICKKTFNLKKSLDVHMFDKHNHWCGKEGCERVFSRRSELLAHVKADHPSTCKQPECAKKVCTARATPTKKKALNMLSHKDYFYCNYPGCDKRYLYVEYLRRHSVTHTDVKPELCEICGKSFRSRKSLSVHLMIHKDVKPLKCEFCDFVCRQRNSMHWHMKKHPDKLDEYKAKHSVKMFEDEIVPEELEIDEGGEESKDAGIQGEK